MLAKINGLQVPKPSLPCFSQSLYTIISFCLVSQGRINGRINIPVNQLLIQARLHWLLTLFRLSAYISLIYITSVHAVPAWSNLPWISPLWHWLIPLGAFRRCVTSSASNQIKAQELAPVSVFSSASREQVVFIIDSVKMHYFPPALLGLAVIVVLTCHVWFHFDVYYIYIYIFFFFFSSSVVIVRWTIYACSLYTPWPTCG